MWNHVFIFGLPRSRTAWVANLLSFGDSLCFHELWADYQTPTEFAEKMSSLEGFAVVGNSDSMNLAMSDWIFENYPDAKFVYLDRNEREVMKSMEKCQPELAFTIPHLREVVRDTKEGVIARNGLILNVDRWNPSDTYLLWDYCLPHIPYPKERNDQLEWMRVTITEDRWDHLKERAKEMAA